MGRFILFRCNKQSFAMDISKVEKIIEFKEPNPIPEASYYLLGVIQYNNRILPIINLGKRFYNVNCTYDTGDRVIVVLWKESLLGFVVDEILGIKSFEESHIEYTALDSNVSKEYISGYIKDEEKIIIILDTDKIFDQEQEQEILSSAEIQNIENLVN